MLWAHVRPCHRKAGSPADALHTIGLYGCRTSERLADALWTYDLVGVTVVEEVL
jgi:hypothetical protein